jgi:hypothetical protein
MSDAGEIVKSGAFDKLADIIHKLAGPMAEEVGFMMADKIKVYRLKNLIAVGKKTEKILKEAHLSPDAVPPRLFLPILEAASIENDEALQDLWAGLLASASEESDSLSPSFIETLKQLTPAEAKTLNQCYDYDNLTMEESHRLLYASLRDNVTLRRATETFERLGLIRREYDLRQGPANLIDQFFISAKTQTQVSPFYNHRTKDDLPELTYELRFTEYGVQFMKACRGPKKDDEP